MVDISLILSMKHYVILIKFLLSGSQKKFDGKSIEKLIQQKRYLKKEVCRLKALEIINPENKSSNLIDSFLNP